MSSAGKVAFGVLAGLIAGAGATLATQKYLSAKYPSMAHCIVREMRGLPNDDIAKLAVFKLCRESFPAGSLAPTGPAPTPKAAAEIDGYDPDRCNKGRADPSVTFFAMPHRTQQTLRLSDILAPMWKVI